MRIVSVEKTQEEIAFAEAAARAFKENPRWYSYSLGDPEQGKLFAIRWNDFAVMIVRIDDEHEPAVYEVAQFIGGDLPPLKTAI